MIPIPTNLERIAAAIEAQTAALDRNSAALDRHTQVIRDLSEPTYPESEKAAERAGKPGFEAWAKLAFPWLGPEGADYRNLRSAFEAGQEAGK